MPRERNQARRRLRTSAPFLEVESLTEEDKNLGDGAQRESAKPPAKGMVSLYASLN
jgi:hypothetical protein